MSSAIVSNSSIWFLIRVAMADSSWWLYPVVMFAMAGLRMRDGKCEKSWATVSVDSFI